MSQKDLVPEILFEDYYLIAINKPAGLMTEDDSFKNPSVENWVKGHLQADALRGLYALFYARYQ